MPGGGGTGDVNTDPECTGIRSNMPCTVEAKMCPNLPCGLGDTGRRSCNCATNWTCESCSFASSPIATKPATADTPCVDVVEGEVCATAPGMPESVCMMGSEYCMCAINPRNTTASPEWDCDSPPSTW